MHCLPLTRFDWSSAHADGMNIATYDLELKKPADTTPKLNTTNFADVRFPEFHLVTATWGSSIIGWRTVFRHPAKLVNIKVNQSASTQIGYADEAGLDRLSLSDVPSMEADVVIADEPQFAVVGHVHTDFAGGKFSWKLDWKSPTAKPTNATQPALTSRNSAGSSRCQAGDDHFSWHRQGYWSYYPPDHIGRISGTALPDTMKADITKVTRPDAFDFNSTKYNCDWASLTDSAGKGIAVTFAPDARGHCKAGVSTNGAYELIVNKYSAPPRDLSSVDVEDLYYTLDQGASSSGQFQVGICGQ